MAAPGQAAPREGAPREGAPRQAAPRQAAPRQVDRIPPVGHCPVLCAQNAGEGVLSGAVLWHFGSPSDWKINTPRQ